jgi:hypothetical protein
LAVTGFYTIYRKQCYFCYEHHPTWTGVQEKEQGEVMLQTTALQRELQNYITRIPAQGLCALKPLLSDLAGPEYVSEPANLDEIDLINEGMTEYYADQSSFTTLDNFKAELRAAGKLLSEA